MFAYYSGVSGTGGQPFSPFLCKNTTTEITAMSFVSFILAAGSGVIDLSLPSRFRALGDKSRLRANGRVLLPLSSKMNANVMEWGLLRIISDYEADPVSALLAFA